MRLLLHRSIYRYGGAERCWSRSVEYLLALSLAWLLVVLLNQIKIRKQPKCEAHNSPHFFTGRNGPTYKSSVQINMKPNGPYNCVQRHVFFQSNLVLL